MFKFLKSWFKDGHETNAFFDNGSTTVSPSHTIPVESLAQAIRSQGEIYTFVSWNLTTSSFSIFEENILTEFDITISNYSRKVTMKKLSKLVFRKPTLGGGWEEIDEKEFVLTDREANYLSQVIKDRHNSDEQKKQHNARQEMEDALQSVLNKQGE